MASQIRQLTYAQALEAVQSGGLLVYPTETLYALGGDHARPEVLNRVFRIKERPWEKTVPLLVGAVDMVGLVADLAALASSQAALYRRLAQAFWPGPLAMLLPPGSGLDTRIVGDNGLVAVRVSSHPLAARMSREAGTALVATSANVSGKPPAAEPDQVDRNLLRQCDGFLAGLPRPAGGPPSTLVSLTREKTARANIVRPGAVTAHTLALHGIPLCGECSG